MNVWTNFTFSASLSFRSLQDASTRASISPEEAETAPARNSHISIRTKNLLNPMAKGMSKPKKSSCARNRMKYMFGGSPPEAWSQQLRRTRGHAALALAPQRQSRRPGQSPRVLLPPKGFCGEDVQIEIRNLWPLGAIYSVCLHFG